MRRKNSLKRKSRRPVTDAGISSMANSPIVLCVLAAAFYGVSSILIMIVNKSVLTIYKFPSFQAVGIGQMVATLIILRLCKAIKVVGFPDFQLDVFWKVWPLPILYLFNLLSGLGGTKRLSLPMFTVLRRFSILFTMIGESAVLHKHSSMAVTVVVLSMILGALIAASNDLAFDSVGYAMVLINDVCTAGNGVYLKKKLESKELGKYGLMYYNALFMLPLALVVAYVSGDLDKAYNFPLWSDTWFMVQFLTTSFIGFVLIWATVVCTSVNSALTTTIVGCLKNVLITYVGMVFGGDYIFSTVNFVGVTISVLGSLAYTYVKFREQHGSGGVERTLTAKPTRVHI